MALAAVLLSATAAAGIAAGGGVGAAPGGSGRSQAIVGWLTVQWSDARDGRSVDPGPSYTLTDDRGRSYAVHPDPAGTGTTPWWRLGGARVTVRGTLATPSEPSADETAPQPARPAILAARLEPGAIARSAQALGDQHWLTLLCRFSDVPGEPHAPEWYLDRYGQTRPRLGHFWLELSYGQLDVDGSVRGWYGLPRATSYYVLDVDGDGELDTLDERRAAQDCTAAADGDVNYPDYDGIQLAFNHPLANYARGGTHFMTLDGESRAWRMTWLPDWAYDNLGVVEHEMGHALGLPHSVATWPTIYDNVWDLMSDVEGAIEPGFGVLGQHTIAFHKDLLGWIGASRTYVVGWGSTATLWLDRLAQPPGLSHLMARIPIQGARTHFYTVEARRLVGYDSDLPAAAVIIHEVDSLRNEPARIVDADADGDTTDEEARWLVGETFVDSANGITVSVVAASADGFQVTVAVQPEPVFTGCAAQAQIPTPECQALVDLYLATAGPAWTAATGWLSSGAPCSWFGVSCSAGHVARLELPQNQLAGALPSSLGQLAHLRRLDLQRNALVGGIPDSIAGLSGLQMLYLNENDLEGPIPAGLGDLDALLVLLLYDNHLTGAIPASLGTLPALQYLYLDANRLEGAVPAQLGGLTRLRALGLRGNKLGGEVPAALAELDDLATLELDYNLLTASDAGALELLARLEPDWQLTQTVAPTGLAVVASTESSVALSWVPISYSANAGFYEIACATSAGGPYTVHGTTAAKGDSTYVVDGLVPATNYWCVVRTFSAAIGYQQNDLWSPLTTEVVGGTTGSPPTVTESASATASATVTATASLTATASPTPTPSETPTDTTTPSETPTPTHTPTVEPTATASATQAVTATETASATSTLAPTTQTIPTDMPTIEPTIEPTATATQEPSATPSQTAVAWPTVTPTTRRPDTRVYLPWLARGWGFAVPAAAPGRPQPSTDSSHPGGSGSGS